MEDRYSLTHTETRKFITHVKLETNYHTSFARKNAGEMYT